MKKLKKFRVPVFWTVMGYHIVKAEDEDDAHDIVMRDDVGLPPIHSEVSDSWDAEIEYRMIEEADDDEEVTIDTYIDTYDDDEDDDDEDDDDEDS